jgi:cardiolipin synthase A/B
VMFDSWGSELNEDWLLEMKLAGVRLLQFAPVGLGGLSRAIAKLRRRNHRKSLIIDGKVAFTGGLNISDDYAAIEDGGRGWRDTHVRLEGPPAIELEKLFLKTWRQHLGPPLDADRYRREWVPEPKVRIIGNDFRIDRKEVRRAYELAMASARERLYLTQAYFTPPAKMIRLMTQAARRGVDVVVILAAATDVGPLLWAARGLYPKLLRAGVRVFEWEGRILHAKTAVVDSRWATIGSTNLDALSLRQNLEVNAVIEDPVFAASVEKMFQEDLYQCRQVTPQMLKERTLFDRFLSWLALQLRNWL